RSGFREAFPSALGKVFQGAPQKCHQSTVARAAKSLPLLRLFNMHRNDSRRSCRKCGKRSAQRSRAVTYVGGVSRAELEHSAGSVSAKNGGLEAGQ
ncbi:hypothetical protein P7K49_023371, partial [Saguinus oedipus]